MIFTPIVFGRLNSAIIYIATMNDKSEKFNNALNIIGSKWTLQIVNSLILGESRFNDIQRCCEVCPRTLSARLDELEKSGIVKKRVEGSNPIKVEYSLTKKGESLSSVIQSISEWSKK